MNTKRAVDDFLAQKTLAVAGVSRSGKKFGNAICTELKAKGYTVYPVNPHAETIGEDRCYPDVASLPDDVGGIITVLKPDQTLQVVRQAAESGIRRIWMQQGSQSDEAVEYCIEEGMELVAGECILMFAEPVESFHKFHRFIWRLFGKLPVEE